MAVAMVFDNPEGSKEQYEAFNMQMFGAPAPTEKPQGLILHTAGEGPNGWRIFDVWESRADFERFMSEMVMPAAEALNIPMGSAPEPVVYELANVFPAQ